MNKNKYISFHIQLSKTEQFLIWLDGFARILDGLVLVLSFGFLISSFSITFMKYRIDRRIKVLKGMKNI